MKDVREGEPFYLEKNPEWKDFAKRHKIYIDGKEKYDAERWPITIESYKSYGCFDKYSLEKEDFFYEKENEEKIRISADLLTNVSFADKIIEGLKLDEKDKKIYNAFLRISYTIGNFCPIWKNGNIGYDTCWDKLNKSGLETSCNYEGIENRCNKPLTHRSMKDLFMILPKENYETPKDVLCALYFQDYFDDNWQLLHKEFSIRDM